MMYFQGNNCVILPDCEKLDRFLFYIKLSIFSDT
jgi:hypothetical protein